MTGAAVRSQLKVGLFTDFISDYHHDSVSVPVLGS